ncbi:MAG: hypothetical protein ACD_49C00017G0009 [uncultured bacterium (gcode 4)]|uniref:Uncharacterized protein n=1 Tax=uncultured bacterium (gcode 4) TaxID=1234023 RepID=K2AYD1_9BACT|nr:MAG: hypothetical protein ACD_49C00017G0009 [uncultured bacterium (gcode 4)]
MKKIIISSFFLISSILFISLALWSDNKDAIFAKTKECVETKFKEKNQEWVWSITNPIYPKRYLVCKWDTPEKAIYQAMLDGLFSEADLEVENYLKIISGKNYTVELGNEISDNFNISSNSGSFYNKYKKICDWKVVEYSAEFVEKYGSWYLSTDKNIKDFLKDDKSSSKCTNLFNTKVKAYEDVAFAMLKRNKVDAYSTDKKTFLDKVKDNYEKLLVKFDRYIWELWLVNDKWNPNKDTKNAKNTWWKK